MRTGQDEQRYDRRHATAHQEARLNFGTFIPVAHNIAMSRFVECVAEFDGAADDELTIRVGLWPVLMLNHVARACFTRWTLRSFFCAKFKSVFDDALQLNLWEW